MFEPFVTKLGQTRFLIWVLEFGFCFFLAVWNVMGKQ